jgi:hypothetical protein
MKKNNGQAKNSDTGLTHLEEMSCCPVESEERIRRHSKNMWSVCSCVCTRKQSSAEELQSASDIGGACPGFEAVGDNGATVQAQGLLLTG